MASPAANLDRFLRIIHRRLRILRFAEYVGVGIMVSAVFAMVIAGLLTWRSAPLLIPSLGCLALGILGGSAWGVAKLPSRLDAAIEADRQLGLADLLGSALLVRELAVMDPWAASVIATADTCCADLSASRVLLHRLGLRTWGGIGLATALVLTIALLAGNPADIRAENVANQLARLSNATTSVRPDHPLLDLTISGASGPIVPRQDVQDEISNRSGENTSPAPDEANPKTQEKRENQTGPNAAFVESPNGQGGGSGRTDTPPPASPAPAVQTVTGQLSNAAGRATAGVGRTDSENARRGEDTASSLNAASTPSVRNIAPWQSDGWPTDVSRAHQAIESGQIPPAYQDLVREYFDRNQ